MEINQENPSFQNDSLTVIDAFEKIKLLLKGTKIDQALMKNDEKILASDLHQRASTQFYSQFHAAITQDLLEIDSSFSTEAFIPLQEVLLTLSKPIPKNLNELVISLEWLVKMIEEILKPPVLEESVKKIGCSFF